MNGSPLDSAPLDNNYLTEEDIVFMNLPCPEEGKVRIVIFEDESEVERYITERDNTRHELNKRVMNFQESVLGQQDCKGQLFFTLSSLLKERMEISEEKSAFDFAFIFPNSNYSTALGLQSDFMTEKRENNGDLEVLHTTFYTWSITDNSEYTLYKEAKYSPLYSYIPSHKKFIRNFLQNYNKLLSDILVDKNNIDTLLLHSKVTA